MADEPVETKAEVLEIPMELKPPGGGNGGGPPPDQPPPQDPYEFFEAPPIQMAPPTDAQIQWRRQNPEYVRTSLGFGPFDSRGTLRPDGTFIAEGPGQPVHDSTDGSYGVGIPRT
jgi:hypothetical protein